MQVGYKIGYYKQRYNGKIREAMITFELLPSSKIFDDRQNEVFDYIKTNIAKIKSIESLDGSPVQSCFLAKKPQLKYEIKTGQIVRFKNAKFSNVMPDFTYIALYTTKIGALNHSIEYSPNFTGVRYHYYKNGKVRQKHNYVDGFRVHTFGYFNNEFNTMNYSWTFELLPDNSFPQIREYIYNQQEKPIAQFLIHEGKIVKQCIYDRTNYIKSIYLLGY